MPVDERVAEFGAALRSAGIPVDAAKLAAFVDALRSSRELGVFDLYWYARITLLSSIERLEAFDRVFTEVWLGTRDDRLARVPREEERIVGVEDRGEEGGEERRADRVVVATAEDVLRETDFADFSREEWRAAQRLMQAPPTPAELRLSRRTVLRPRGRRLDVGATLRRELQTFGIRAEPRYRVRRSALRPVVFLCDVSGSMVPYGRALLQYGYVLSRARPKVTVFAFTTRLTELTLAFRRAHSPARFDAAVRALRDWAGGTAIGASLRAYNRAYALRGGARGATVVIVSDGCEREDPALLAGEMALLARLSRRIVWVNPQNRDPAYEPLTRGMRAALPHIDAFLDGHNLRSLGAVADAIRGVTAHLISPHRRTLR